MIQGIFLIAVFLLVGCSDGRSRTPLTLVSPDGIETIVQAEIADEPEERQQGLMLRESMPENAGMLFVFEKPNVLYFWMQNTLIPLDVLFFDEDGNFVSMETMEPCKIKDCPSYNSASPAVYALEVNAGLGEEMSIGTGWDLRIPQE